jgi:hypothetical protein
MKCPNCNNQVEPSIDQIAAATAVGVTVPVMAVVAPYVAAMFVAPYVAPVFLVGMLWSSLRKKRCPKCGHRFTILQEGKK